MTTQEENDRLCLIEGDAPMGTAFRRYWLPFALAEELPEPDCPPIRVRILGEDLVAFRDTDGAVGLLDAHCPHRQAPLYFGRNEECGLRCVYHGWKFDITGQCVDMPSEPDYSKFKYTIRATAYPTWEAAGMLFAYLGPETLRPPTPDYEWVRVPESHRVVSKAMEHCNYLQAVEGGIDAVHTSFLHNNDIQSPLLLRSRDKHPPIEVQLTDFGYRYACLRDIGEGRVYARVDNFLLPSMNSFSRTVDEIGQPAKLPIVTFLFWVPIDNVTTAIYNICCRTDPGAPFPPEFGPTQQANFGIGAANRIPGTYWNKRNIGNDYLIDRTVQRYKTYTGIEGIGVQDYAVQEGMGLICDRTKEHVASSDRAVVAARKLLLEMVETVQSGGDPKGLRPESHRAARAADKFIGADTEWRGALAGEMAAVW